MFGFKRRKAERKYAKAMQELCHLAERYLSGWVKSKHSDHVRTLTIPVPKDEKWSKMNIVIKSGFAYYSVEVKYHDGNREVVLAQETYWSQIYNDYEFERAPDGVESDLMFKAYVIIGELIKFEQRNEQAEKDAKTALRDKVLANIDGYPLTKEVVFAADQ
jgi:hypothetical protein